MKHCPITYEPIQEDESYSQQGLRLLSRNLKNLEPFALTAKEQRQQAMIRTQKMSIQGVQPKFSAILKVGDEKFDVVDNYGQYVLKPQSEFYPELPENEALSMSLAAIIHIEIPLHGLLYCKDGSFTYFIKRFDRHGRNKKYAIEDFAQLTKKSREVKYESSMEKVAHVIERYCTFPRLEAIKLFERTLFNFLIGNEDMHLKNFFLITRGNKTQLSPAYDLLNTTIAQPNTREELALPLHGKKSNLLFKDFIDYYGTEQLGLNQQVISAVLARLSNALPAWRKLIQKSFLSNSMQNKYLDLLNARATRLKL